MRIALFAGSFDPFTIAHENIVRRGLDLFDKIVIGIGRNVNKQFMLTAEERKEAIQHVFEAENRVEVVIYDGLTVGLAQKVGARFLLRGVRDTADFCYEQQMAAANKQLAGVETVLLIAEPQLAHISSTLVRDLCSHNCDVSKYLP